MDHDIIIVGGGMVGATLACALAPAGLRIAVVEGHPAQRFQPGDDYDIRVSAITRATQRVFQNIGAWQAMEAARVTPYEHMHVWDETGSGSIDFDAADIGEPDLGLIVENSIILSALLQRMEDFDNIQLLCPARVQNLHRWTDGVSLQLQDGPTLEGRLIVGADGAESWVREQAQIQTTGWTYEQTAVVATITTSKPHGGTAYQRFMPTGPLAFLPMPEGKSSIVWSTTPEQAAELMALDEAAFLERLQQIFGNKLGDMEATGPRGAFPLQLKHAHHYCTERLVLVGNAAHAIHPLAGQGLNLGVADAAVLCEVLLKAGAKKEDMGEFGVLRRYERWRKGDNVAVMAAMDGFKRLFSNDVLPLKVIRNIGLNLADHAGPVKNLMIKRAMGLEGELPSLATGRD